LYKSLFIQTTPNILTDLLRLAELLSRLVKAVDDVLGHMQNVGGFLFQLFDIFSSQQLLCSKYRTCLWTITCLKNKNPSQVLVACRSL
jgi:hypothetical protein